MSAPLAKTQKPETRLTYICQSDPEQTLTNTREDKKKRHRNQILANSHDTSPQEDAEQNPQLHSGVTSPLPPLIQEPEKAKGKDGLDLTSRLKAKALQLPEFLSPSVCICWLEPPPPSNSFSSHFDSHSYVCHQFRVPCRSRRTTTNKIRKREKELAINQSLSQTSVVVWLLFGRGWLVCS